jgi:hypothetical protein
VVQSSRGDGNGSIRSGTSPVDDNGCLVEEHVAVEEVTIEPVRRRWLSLRRDCRVPCLARLCGTSMPPAFAFESNLQPRVARPSRGRVAQRQEALPSVPIHREVARPHAHRPRGPVRSDEWYTGRCAMFGPAPRNKHASPRSPLAPPNGIKRGHHHPPPRTIPRHHRRLDSSTTRRVSKGKRRINSQRTDQRRAPACLPAPDSHSHRSRPFEPDRCRLRWQNSSEIIIPSLAG